MSVRVTVTDLETGDSESRIVADGDYMIVTTDPCYVDGFQIYRSGATHVITVKGRQAPAPATPAPEAGGAAAVD